MAAAVAALWLTLHRRHLDLHRAMAADAVPSFVTDRHGGRGLPNRAAQQALPGVVSADDALVALLGRSFADPRLVVRRLIALARVAGTASEDVVTARSHQRVTVQAIPWRRLVWRVLDLTAPEPDLDGPGAEAVPRVTVDPQGRVRSQNGAMTALIGGPVVQLARLIGDRPPRHASDVQIATARGREMRTIVIRALPDDLREIYLFAPPASAPPADPTSFEALPVALLRLSAEGRIVLANRAARALLGPFPADAALVEVLEGLGRPVVDWIAEALRGVAESRPEVLRARRSDREIYLQVSLSRVTQAGQSGLVAVLSDATALKTLEAQFVQSQKMQAIGQLAGGVAHDFNNLLTAISGHCDLLMLRRDPADSDYADLDQIRQNANRAASLVGQLLAFSRKQTLKLRVMDLRDTLSDLTHLLNRLVGERVQLTLAHDADLPPIRADKRQFEQVIMNLVVNARDAMPAGGTIRVETERLALDAAMMRDRATVPEGCYVVVRVIDAGTGIPPDRIGKIFDPFYTTKRTGEGTGLGLSTAYGIMKQTGGFIFADSTPGQGSVFSLYFPAHAGPVEDEVEADPAPVTLRSATKGTATVLLVEDEAPVRAFASRALRLKNLTVYEAENAEEAMRVLEDPDLAIDVFVTDVIMPGMDGPSWVREALKTRPGTRVIFVSGYAEDIFEDGRPEVPGSVFLPKPFSLRELTDTVLGQLV
ncbi:ATP-binding response regulator [Paracoccus zhouxuedongae]